MDSETGLDRTDSHGLLLSFELSDGFFDLVEANHQLIFGIFSLLSFILQFFLYDGFKVY